jgi:phage/plasmid-like protein (TIGR03299 family)
MAHELTIRENGKAEMAFVGETPWHGLGQELQAGASKDEWIKAAGFDFSVERAPVQFTAGDIMHSMGDREVLYRSDNAKPLSVVSPVFKIVQPDHIMDYFDDLARKAGFVLDTAGTLYGGRQFWALANIGDESCVRDKRDRIKGRLLMATSVDLSIPTILKFVIERVVCHNTLTWGLQEKGASEVRVRHNSVFKPGAVNEQLGITAHEQFQSVMDDLRKLADTPMSDLDMVNATVALVRPGAFELAQDQLMKVLNSRPVQRIGELAVENRSIGAELDGAHGTAWGWLNATTQYVDHEMRAHTADGRLHSAWFGRGDALKSRALGIAVMAANGETTYKQEYEDASDGLLDQVLEQTVAEGK